MFFLFIYLYLFRHMIGICVRFLVQVQKVGGPSPKTKLITMIYK